MVMIMVMMMVAVVHITSPSGTLCMKATTIYMKHASCFWFILPRAGGHVNLSASKPKRANSSLALGLSLACDKCLIAAIGSLVSPPPPPGNILTSMLWVITSAGLAVHTTMTRRKALDTILRTRTSRPVTAWDSPCENDA